MSLLAIFDIGKSALYASQLGLDVTSHNISNVNTPGYSKQDAILSIQTPVHAKGGLLGRGVLVTDVRRSYDRFLQYQILSQKQSLGLSTALNEGLEQVENVFNEQKGVGLFNSLQAYFNAWEDVAANPDSTAHRAVLYQSAVGLLDRFRSTEERLVTLYGNTSEEISAIIERINTIAGSVAELNNKVAQIEADGEHQANDLRDRRDLLLEELAEYVDFTSFEDRFGRITVVVGERNLVEGEYVTTMNFSEAFDGTVSITMDSVDITDTIGSGRVEGLMRVRETIEDTLKRTRRLMASLVNETNLIHQTGFAPDGSTGLDFFNSLTLSSRDYSAGAGVTSLNIADYSLLTMDEYEIRFTAANAYEVYSVDTGSLITSGTYVSGNTITFDGIDVVITDDAGGPQAGDRFVVSPIEYAINASGLAISDPRQIAASATLAGLPGDNRKALEMVDLYRNGVAVLGGESFSGYYSSIVAEAGTLSSAARDSLEFEQAIMDDLRMRRESVSGVSLDEEAINLVKYQKAFEAGARLIQVTDELLDTLIRI